MYYDKRKSKYGKLNQLFENCTYFTHNRITTNTDGVMFDIQTTIRFLCFCPSSNANLTMFNEVKIINLTLQILQSNMNFVTKLNTIFVTGFNPHINI